MGADAVHMCQYVVKRNVIIVQHRRHDFLKKKLPVFEHGGCYF